MSRRSCSVELIPGFPPPNRATHGAALFLGILVFAVSCRYTQVFVEGWDPLAYMLAAEHIANGEKPALCHPYNEDIGPYFTMAGFNVRSPDPACLYLNYPPGYPVLLAIAAKLVPVPDVMSYVPAFFGGVGIVLTYALGCLVTDARVALTSAVLLGLTPLYLRFSTAPWSDLPVAILLLAGLVTLIWADRKSGMSWQIAGGVGAAVLIGWAVFGRYSAVVFLVPVFAYAITGRKLSSALRAPSLRAFGVGILVSMIAVGLYNASHYGGVLKTPYSPEHGWYEWPMFGLKYALGDSPVGAASLTAVMETLWEAYGLLLLFGALGVVAVTGRPRVVLLTGSGCFAALYALYAFPARGINGRFLLPVLPFTVLLIASGFWCTLSSTSLRLWLWRGLALAVVAIELCAALPATLRGLDSRNRAAQAYIDGIRTLASETAPESVFLAYHANDALLYYGERASLFYRRIIPGQESEESGASYFESRLVDAVARLLGQGVPVYYMLDTDPPLMNSLSVLRDHFDVTPSSRDVSVYRVDWQE